MGVLKPWSGAFKSSYWMGIRVFLKLYTGPGGQSNPLILWLWPAYPNSVFYLLRTNTGIEFGVNANSEFTHWSPDACYLRDLYSYIIDSCEVPNNTWVNVEIGSHVTYRKGAEIQINNEESPFGGMIHGTVLVEWGHPDNLYTSSKSDVSKSNSYIREWRASPPPTCYTAPGSFKYFEYYGPRLPNSVTGLAAGRSAVGNEFEGAIMEVSIWNAVISEETRDRLRRIPGYALQAPEHTEDGKLRVYWPLITDGATDFQGAEQDNDLTATPSGTAAISDCYNYAQDGYEPWPFEPGKGRAVITQPITGIVPGTRRRVVKHVRTDVVPAPVGRTVYKTARRSVSGTD